MRSLVGDGELPGAGSRIVADGKIGDGGPALKAKLDDPWAVAVSPTPRNPRPSDRLRAGKTACQAFLV